MTTQLTVIGLVNHSLLMHDSSFNNLMEQNTLDFKSMFYESIDGNISLNTCFLNFHCKL